MTAHDRLARLIGNTSTDYLDAHFGEHSGPDDIASQIIGDVFRDAADWLEGIGEHHAAAMLRYEAEDDEREGQGASQAEKPRTANGMDPRLILGIAPDWPYPNRSEEPPDMTKATSPES
jgi:hypothetical protein